MSKSRRDFERPPATRRYKRLFVIAVEGKVTEPRYFAIFNNLFPGSALHVDCIKGKSDSSPKSVLERMERWLKREGLKASDEAWIVVDKDNWTDAQLSQLHEWSKSSNRYGFALSNPKFEYWLLLHFEDGNDITSPHECDKRLKKHMSKFSINSDFSNISQQQIKDAVSRAKKRDTPPCKDWPHTIGGTTVYRLVERLGLSG